MTLDASSHATLADVKRGGGVAAERMIVVLSVVRQVGEASSTVSWSFPGNYGHTLYWS